MKRAKNEPQRRRVRCAVYTRKSTEEGLDQEFNSLDAQRESAEAFIASQRAEGWECLPDRYDDGGFSGGDMERPALRRMLAGIEAGGIDCVVVYKVDRLSRSLMDFARIMEKFDARNISFVSVTQQFNTTHSMGRLTLNILLSFAQFEREIIGERIRDKLAAQRRKGKWVGGSPVLGYDVDRTGRSPKLVVNAREAAQVVTIFKKYLEFGSLTPLAEEVARRGWCRKERTGPDGRRRGGRPFDKASLYHLLMNPTYIGRVKHHHETFAGEPEAIVAGDLFAKVQERLRHNGRTKGNKLRNRYGALLRGLLHCKACGCKMVHTFTGRNQKRWRYYICNTAIKAGWKKCPTKSLPAAEIERVVVEQIRCITHDEALRAEVLRQAQSQVDAELADLRSESGRLNRELGRHRGELRSDATPARISELSDRIAAAEDRSREVAQRIAALERGRLTEQDVDSAFGDFDEVWRRLSPKEQVRVMALLVARVDFDVAEGTVAIAFHDSGIRELARQGTEDAA